MAEETKNKKANTGLMIFGGVILLALIGVGIYFFTKTADTQKEVTTQTSSSGETGLSSLLSGLNLSFIGGGGGKSKGG